MLNQEFHSTKLLRGDLIIALVDDKETLCGVINNNRDERVVLVNIGGKKYSQVLLWEEIKRKATPEEKKTWPIKLSPEENKKSVNDWTAAGDE